MVLLFKDEINAVADTADGYGLPIRFHLSSSGSAVPKLIGLTTWPLFGVPIKLAV